MFPQEGFILRIQILLPKIICDCRLGTEHIGGGAVGTAASLVIYHTPILKMFIKFVIISGFVRRLPIHKIGELIGLLFPWLIKQIQRPHLFGNFLRQNLGAVKPGYLRDIHTVRAKLLSGSGGTRFTHAPVKRKQRLHKFKMPGCLNSVIIKA